MEPEDLPEAGRICYEAFGTLHKKLYGRILDFPTPEFAAMILGGALAKAKTGKACVFVAVGEQGKIIGSNAVIFEDEAAVSGQLVSIPTSRATERAANSWKLSLTRQPGAAANPFGWFKKQLTLFPTRCMPNSDLCLWIS